MNWTATSPFPVNWTEPGHGPNRSVNIPGLISVIIFYVIIFAAGIYASWRSKKKNEGRTQTSEDLMLAGRSLGMVVGLFTMTATWVGGAFINGTAEMVFSPGFGLAWCQAPFCYSVSLALGGFIFAKPMREAGYTTMLDPFNDRYGPVMAGLLYIPALMGETFWSGAVLSALGSSLAVILNLDHTLSVLVSAGIAVVYTMVGGLYSVAYTDVVQLVCIFIGLWLGVGFSLFNPAVSNIASTMTGGTDGWLGDFPKDQSLGLWIDNFFLLSLGGIPWQVYFQRVLSSTSANRARILSVLACFGCFLMAVPAIITGAIAKSTDWNATSYVEQGGILPIPAEDHKLILPMVLRYLCPLPVALVGLGAVSAAVMSSADSSILSAASMFSHNIYAPIRNAVCCGKEASDKEVIWLMRLGIIIVGAFATLMAITVESIYGLWYLCSDLCFVVLFPQLVCVVYFKRANTYGALAGFLVGFALRFTGGEALVGLPPLIKYPYFDEETNTQNFPFKTLAMLLSFGSIIVISLIVRCIYARLMPDADLDYILLRRATLKSKGPVSEDSNENYKNKNQTDYDETDYTPDEKVSSM